MADDKDRLKFILMENKVKFIEDVCREMEALPVCEVSEWVIMAIEKEFYFGRSVKNAADHIHYDVIGNERYEDDDE
ncbi:MAG: hypothetical protein KAR20_20355 [Candidatus Heimdallarchaeota archaeon]|nr:hypothetical protein [Candidatus Heimdallarchaeota archaeon]